MEKNTACDSAARRGPLLRDPSVGLGSLSARVLRIQEQVNVRVLGHLTRWSERRRPRAPLERRARVVGVDEDPKLRLARVPRLERLRPPVRRRADEARGF